MTIPKSPGNKNIFLSGNWLLYLLNTHVKKVHVFFDSSLPCCLMSSFSKVKLLIL